MNKDEEAIRDLVDEWLEASKRGDIETLAELMADDVIFMVPAQEPFGKAAFIARSDELKNASLEATSDIKEIKVLGDWAWMRNFLEVTFKPREGQPVERTGYVLTILHKRPDGKWVIARDANLLTPKS